MKKKRPTPGLPAESKTHLLADMNGLRESTPEFLTKIELAAKLRKSSRTITEWMNDGLLPYIKVRHTVLFNWEDTKRALAERFTVGTR